MTTKRIFHTSLVLAVLFWLLFGGCRKDEFITDPGARLAFSTDTLTFDTVFTVLGSTTKFFKIYNKHNRKIKISEIRLAGGDQSFFRLNVDGIPGNVHTDLEINPDDSMYVFVEVTIDPNTQNLPFVVLDSVLFYTNGNRQRVVLEAWGQNAHFHVSQTVCDEVWTNDLPHVILRYALVDSGCTLQILQGAKLYFGGSAGLYVHGTASLQVTGNKDQPVVFRGIRLEKFYEDLPGQWLGIFILRGSTGNVMEHAIVENSDYGISLGSSVVPDLSSFTFANAPEITLRKCIIRNHFLNGISGILSTINAENCLIVNSGDYLVSLGLGGNYDFKHCTMANYGSIVISHQKPVLLLSNLAETADNLYLAGLNATFTNSIIYGSLDNEIEFSDAEEPGVAFNFRFDHSLIKTDQPTDSVNRFVNIIKNEDPQFVDVSEVDFHLQPTSPAVNAGRNDLGIPDDLDENPRDAQPDLGAYEYAE